MTPQMHPSWLHLDALIASTADACATALADFDAVTYRAKWAELVRLNMARTSEHVAHLEQTKGLR